MKEGMEEQKKWKISDVGRFLRESLIAIIKGEFLLRLNIGRYFLHIVYIFFLCGMVIWTSLMIDSTLTEVEKNKREIRELEIVHSQKQYELTTLDRRTEVEARLRKMGSAVSGPVKPAKVIAE